MAADPGGVAGRHRGRVSLPIVVGSSTKDQFNTLRLTLLPIACWRLEDVRFDFESSLIRPEASAEFTLLASLWHETAGPPMSVFGHADPVGDDEFNKTLSGRRTKAVYALLIRDAAMWEELYSHPFSGDDWSKGGVRLMLSAVGSPSVKAFQEDHGLAADGAAGPATRRELFLAYMDAICHDAAGQPFSVQPTDFLGGGSDPGGKADYQGCSEFNPVRVFSTAETQAFAAPARRTERNAANAINRRVLVFLFPVGSKVAAEEWPCPRATEGSAGCRAQFWPDGDLRRNPQEKHREYEKDRNTFACAFYDRMARRSPCETVRKTLRIRLFDPDKGAIPNAPYRVTVIAAGDERNGTARRIDDQEGWLVEPNLVAPSRCLIEWGDPRLQDIDPVPLSYSVNIFLDIDAEDVDEAGFRRRLHNLGYTKTEDLADAVRAFQKDYDLEPSGELDQPTKDSLLAANDRGATKAEIAAGA